MNEATDPPRKPEPSGPTKAAMNTLPTPPAAVRAAHDPDPATLVDAESAVDHEGFAPLVPPPRPGTSSARRVALFVGGALLFVVGTVLWITPVVTGAVPFWVGGAVMMGAGSKRVGAFFNRLEARLPVRGRKLLRWRPGGRKGGA